MASVAGRCPASGVHPPIRYRRPGSGGPAVQCPARPVTWVVVRVSGGPVVCCPPVRGPAFWCPPVQRPAGWRPAPWVRTRPSPPMPDGSVGPGRCGGHPSPRERVESRWAAAPSSGSVDGRAGLDAGGAAEVACWSSRGSVADLGRVWCGRRRCGREQAAARGGRTCRVAASLVGCVTTVGGCRGG
jgi:hypothetical protein